MNGRQRIEDLESKIEALRVGVETSNQIVAREMRSIRAELASGLTRIDDAIKRGCESIPNRHPEAPMVGTLYIDPPTSMDSKVEFTLRDASKGDSKRREPRHRVPDPPADAPNGEARIYRALNPIPSIWRAPRLPAHSRPERE